MKVENLLRPKKVIIVGASERESSFGGDTCKNIMDFSNPDKYYFVNPNRDAIFGRKAYKSIGEIEDKCDLIVICTPKETVEGLLRDAAAKGCTGAVIYASGYSETGLEEDRLEEDKLVNLCNELGISLLGPNCGGFINYHDDIYSFAFVAEKRDRKGSIGLISQSGQLCLSMMDSPKGKFSYVISAGNAAGLKVEEYIEYLVEDENTKVVAVYLEGVSKPEVFIRALSKAAKIKKPVVILKTGKSEKGSQISASHTGSLSGSDKAYDAIFKKFGVIRVDDMEELMSMSYLLSTLKKEPSGTNFSAMSVSGGETIITADLAEEYGIEFPKFEDKTLKGLKELLPYYATPNNPLDMTASISYDSDKFASAIELVIGDENVDMIILGYTLLLDVVDPCIKYMTEGIEKVVNKIGHIPLVMMPFMENTRNTEYMNKLADLGVPILPTSSYGMSVMKKYKEFIDYNYEERTLELALPEAKDYERVFLSENKSKEILGDYGISVPKAKVVTSVDEAIAFAEENGFPLVMKIESDDIPHKSDIGGVKLNINSNEEVKAAYEEIIYNAETKAKGAKINGILIQEMLDKGIEVIVGINNDPTYGPMVLCGLGGVFVEIFKDVSLYPAPFNKAEAYKMIESLKGYTLLKGYRGSKEADLDELTDLLVKISEFAAENKDSVAELDINPVFLYEESKGLAIADALMIVKE